MNKKIDVIEIDEQPDLLEETYEILNKRLNIIEQLNKKTKSLELLKFENEKLVDDNKKIKTKYNEKEKEIKKLSSEIKTLKSESIELEKKILMLKTLIKIIFKEYGMESILKTTKLSLDQIKKYLN